MKKRILSFIVALILALSVASVAYADEIIVDSGDVFASQEFEDDTPDDLASYIGSYHWMVDDAQLLSDDEVYNLDTLLSQISQEHQFDIVIVTVQSCGNKTPQEYADDYYDYNGYGYGENHDGCLLLVSMDERDWHISTTGYGIYAITDAGIDFISSCFIDDLSAGNYFDAFSTFACEVEDFINQADSGDPYDYDTMPEPDGGLYTLKGILYGAIAGLIIALIVVTCLKSKMKTVRHKADANDYLVAGSFVLTNKDSRHVNTHVSKTRRETSSGGSSTHTGSSGTSHGGGGGKF